MTIPTKASLSKARLTARGSISGTSSKRCMRANGMQERGMGTVFGRGRTLKRAQESKLIPISGSGSKARLMGMGFILGQMAIVLKGSGSNA